MAGYELLFSCSGLEVVQEICRRSSIGVMETSWLPYLSSSSPRYTDPELADRRGNSIRIDSVLGCAGHGPSLRRRLVNSLVLECQTWHKPLFPRLRTATRDVSTHIIKRSSCIQFSYRCDLHGWRQNSGRLRLLPAFNKVLRCRLNPKRKGFEARRHWKKCFKLCIAHNLAGKPHRHIQLLDRKSVV